MSFFGLVSQATFKTLKFADDWIGLPQKTSESLFFRREWREYLKDEIPVPERKSRLWIHGASVGELEDLASFFLSDNLVNASGFKTEDIIITASSISAKTKLKEWAKLPFAYVGPLPPEDRGAIEDFLTILQPDLLLLSHSDFWPRLLELANGVLRTGVLWLPNRAKSKLMASVCLVPEKTWIGMRTPNLKLLPALYRNEFVGSTRLDRVFARIETAKLLDDHVLAGHHAAPDPQRVSILIGSAWLEDAMIWSKALGYLTPEEKAKLQIVVIPHEFNDSHQVASVQGVLEQARVLALGGILVEAYNGFSAAFVGGGFRTGLHNILEPALWGIPVFSGPDTKKQPEAPWLEENSHLHTIKNPEDLALWLKKLLSPLYAQVREHAQISGRELGQHRGASSRLAQLIRKFSLHRLEKTSHP